MQKFITAFVKKYHRPLSAAGTHWGLAEATKLSKSSGGKPPSPPPPKPVVQPLLTKNPGVGSVSEATASGTPAKRAKEPVVKAGQPAPQALKMPTDTSTAGKLQPLAAAELPRPVFVSPSSGQRFTLLSNLRIAVRAKIPHKHFGKKGNFVMYANSSPFDERWHIKIYQQGDAGHGSRGTKVAEFEGPLTGLMFGSTLGGPSSKGWRQKTTPKEGKFSAVVYLSQTSRQGTIKGPSRRVNFEIYTPGRQPVRARTQVEERARAVLNAPKAKPVVSHPKRGPSSKDLRKSGPSQPAVSKRSRLPKISPSRAIKLPKIVVDESLLKRLATRSVRLPADLRPGQRNSLKGVAKLIKAGNMNAASAQWRDVLTSYISRRSRGSDINSMIYFVLRPTVVGFNQDRKVSLSTRKKLHAMKDDLAGHLEKMKDAMRSLEAQANSRASSFSGRRKALTVDVITMADVLPGRSAGSGDTLRWETKTMDRDTLRTGIRNVERRLADVRSDEKLDNLELQKMLQKEQQTLEMMSQISKLLHDIAMGIIRKIG